MDRIILCFIGLITVHQCMIGCTHSLTALSTKKQNTHVNGKMIKFNLGSTLINY